LKDLTGIVLFRLDFEFVGMILFRQCSIGVLDLLHRGPLLQQQGSVKTIIVAARLRLALSGGVTFGRQKEPNDDET
jgi:hypothetical protein